MSRKDIQVAVLVDVGKLHPAVIALGGKAPGGIGPSTGTVPKIYEQAVNGHGGITAGAGAHIKIAVPVDIAEDDIVELSLRREPARGVDETGSGSDHPEGYRYQYETDQCNKRPVSTLHAITNW